MEQLSSAPPLLDLALRQGLTAVASRLGELAGGLFDDLAALEVELDGLYAPPSGPGGRRVPGGPAPPAARHLLAGGGKRVRPLLCLLAARGFGSSRALGPAAELARAAELVHAATLLHDDVIDLGETRRGRPAARLVYGNAASVLGGDLLLVEALQRIQAAGTPALLAAMLGVLERMIEAESLQLAKRGRAELVPEEYFAIVRGKTASLFEWALEAGGWAGGAGEGERGVLRAFGAELGVAFQLADDLLDLADGPERAAEIGKAVLQDVRQGTITYPVLFALREDRGLGDMLVAAADGAPAPELPGRLAAALARSGGCGAARRQLQAHTERARTRLRELGASPARDALDEVARALGERVS